MLICIVMEVVTQYNKWSDDVNMHSDGGGGDTI